MAIDSQLLQFKSPGTKILTKIIPNIPQTSMPSGARILVVNSKKGDVNTPVPISSFDEYLAKFDGISDADERRGNWGARSAELMLAVAPIYVLNLRLFDDNIDKAGFAELSLSAQTSNNIGQEKPYSKLFNTNQFWKIDPQTLVSNQNLDKLLVFGNIGSADVSLIVKATNTNQPTLTFAKWYANLGKEMPAFVDPADTVDSWFIDVYVFKNTFNANSVNNPSYGHLFDANGQVKNVVVNTVGRNVPGVEQLAAIPESGYVAKITGSLVQGFTDAKGQIQDIVEVMNSTVSELGIVCARNEQLLDDVAMWFAGDTIENNEMKRPNPVDLHLHSIPSLDSAGMLDLSTAPNTIKMLSYDIVPTYPDNENDIWYPFEGLPSDEETAHNDIVVTGYASAKTVDTSSAAIELIPLASNSTIVQSRGIDMFKRDELTKIIIDDSVNLSIGDKVVAYDANLSTVTAKKNIGSYQVITVQTADCMLQPVKLLPTLSQNASFDRPGEEFPKHANGYYVYPAGHALENKPVAFTNDNLTGASSMPISGGSYFFDPRANVDTVAYMAALDAFNDDVDVILEAEWNSEAEYTTAGKLDTFKSIVEKFAKTNNIYEVSFDKKVYAESGTGNSEKIDENETPYFDYHKKAFKSTAGEVYNILDSGANDARIFKVNHVSNIVSALKPITLKSYKLRNNQFLDGTADRQSAILDTLLQTNLLKALSNRDLLKWNYIVDGFKSFIGPDTKYQLKRVAEERIIARSIYNMPSIYDFSRSTNPYFSQEIDGNFEARFIASGGNLQLPHNNTFSLPSTNGWYAYGFGPHLTLSGTAKTMPPAAAVSNLFQAKYLNGKPYIILGGPEDGAIRGKNISGVEHVFNESNAGDGDRDYLDPFGYNVIVQKSSGIQIYGNKTSHNTVNTPVSAIHTSEVLMFIQQRINEMLENYVFKANNSQNRLAIEMQANDICDEPLGAGAISGYRNVIDRSNNTDEVIANRIGILDTTLFDNSGMEILVHRTTVDTRTNMASFQVLRSNL